MNAFIAQKLEQVLHFERDQQIARAGEEIPNPFQTMISQVEIAEEVGVEEVSSFLNLFFIPFRCVCICPNKKCVTGWSYLSSVCLSACSFPSATEQI